ncbi:DUF4231 domain-containing protein [Amycolatopsis sp. NPDC048633]|uniref:DUF4231 domain-containing protein n=1 Tax=Amycolatopsis sp. NPDC048633 TaxID=3157095 RepID=UPI0033EDD2A9
MAAKSDDLQERKDRAVARWQGLVRNWRGRARRSRLASKLFTYGCVTLTVGTTAIAGVQTVPRSWIIVASAGAALAAGLMSATRSHEHWTASREVQNRLSSEHFLFEQGAGSYRDLSDQERVLLFSERISEIGMAGHDSWARHVSEGARTVTKTDDPAP